MGPGAAGTLGKRLNSSLSVGLSGAEGVALVQGPAGHKMGQVRGETWLGWDEDRI